MEKQRKVYTAEFKKQAVELAVSLGNHSQAARQLGVSDVSLHEWKKKLGVQVFPRGLSAAEQEVLRLKKENAELKKINHVLKVAAAFFSQDQLK